MGKCLFMRKGETHTSPHTGILLSDIAEWSTVTLQASSYTVTKQSGTSTTLMPDESGEEVALPGTAVLNDDGSVTI